MGPYPFENLGIQPKMRSGRRFENQNQCLQPCTAPNCKKQLNKTVTGNSIVTISFQLPKQFRNSRKLSKVIPSKATKKSTKELCTENSRKLFVENSQWGQSNYEVTICM